MAFLRAVLGLGHDLRSVVSDEDGVLELGGEAAVGGADSPVVAAVEFGFGRSEVQHRFDREAHAGVDDDPFGAGGGAMGDAGVLVALLADAVTLGLDAFCQKFLVWEDEQGRVFLSFNDLLALAERQDVPKRLPLRVINFRLNSVFSEALAEQ